MTQSLPAHPLRLLLPHHHHPLLLHVIVEAVVADAVVVAVVAAVEVVAVEVVAEEVVVVVDMVSYVNDQCHKHKVTNITQDYFETFRAW